MFYFWLAVSAIGVAWIAVVLFSGSPWQGLVLLLFVGVAFLYDRH